MNAGLKALLDQIIAVILKSVAGLSGARLYLAKKILEFGGQYLIDLITSAYTKFLRTKKQEKAIEELEKVDKDPKSTIDDKGKAYADAINAGRD